MSSSRAVSETLDPMDAALISELQRDGRASVQALADRIGASRSAVSARLRRLTESGVVRVVGIIHGAVAGLTTVAHVSVDVRGRASDVLDAVADREAASFVSLVAGHHSIVVELRTRDDGALEHELDRIRRLESVNRLSVFRRGRLVKDVYSVRRDFQPITLDRVDVELLAELQRDGRAPYSRLAALVGMSQNATRARVGRLIASGTVHVSGLVDSSALGIREHAGLGLRVDRPALEVAEHVAEVPGIVYVLTGFGSFDVLAVADAGSRAAIADTIDDVRAVPGVTDLHAWHHLRILKESYAVDVSGLVSG
jgi:DNA-binding Lrp family transcriptional regulator